MITKRQWNKFCGDVEALRRELGYARLTLKGRNIEGVTHCCGKYPVIVTVKAGEPKMLFKYKESIDNDMSLEHLYKSIGVTNVDMSTLKKLGMFR